MFPPYGITLIVSYTVILYLFTCDNLIKKTEDMKCPFISQRYTFNLLDQKSSLEKYQLRLTLALFRVQPGKKNNQP